MASRSLLADRKSTTLSERPLFGSVRSDEFLPQQHRKSIALILDQVGNSTSKTLTCALLESFPEDLKAATEASFLRLAGTGELSKHQASRWLSQNRLYAETYISFVTSLIARVDLPYAFVADKSNSLRWRIVHLLTYALQNIHRELELFTLTAEKYNLQLDLIEEQDEQAFMPNEITQQYIDLFKSFHNDPSLPLIEGMVVLWATEQCHLKACSYAASLLENDSNEQDADGGALRGQLIPSWTSPEFRKFVDDIAEVTDLLAIREQAGKKLAVYKAVWSHVLDIEKNFWSMAAASKK